jgi:proliferating cell nuclear antigen
VGESLTEVKKDVAKKKPKKEKSEKEDEKEGEDENLSRIVFKVEEPCQTIYSLRYMNMFAKAAPLSNHVRLSVSSELPIIVKFPLEEEERGHLSFFLAPKIDE